MVAPTIAALLTCHNRRALTLQCLARLHAQEGRDQTFALDVYLVDDGSSDGTSEAVSDQFPSVRLLRADGSCFWNGGMRRAWATALPGKYDFYLWVNDDTLLDSTAIYRLLQDYAGLLQAGERPGAIAGTVLDPDSNLTAYGGHRIASSFNHLQMRLLEPLPHPQRCDFFNGNIVMVPTMSVARIGILEQAYKHAYGDFDYAWRLQRAELSCWVGSDVSGQCRVNKRDYELDLHASLRMKLAQLRRMERLYPYRDHMLFVRRCAGKFWPIWWAKAWLRGNIPLLWILITRKA